MKRLSNQKFLSLKNDLNILISLILLLSLFFLTIFYFPLVLMNSKRKIFYLCCLRQSLENDFFFISYFFIFAYILLFRYNLSSPLHKNYSTVTKKKQKKNIYKVNNIQNLKKIQKKKMKNIQSSFSEELSKCYKIKQMKQYITNQISKLIYPAQSIRCNSSFTMIKFKVPSISTTYAFATDHGVIQFMFVLSKNYPLYQPRLHLLNNLLRPGINDSRDFIPNLLLKTQSQNELQKWTYKQTLRNLQQRIPKFLQSIKKQTDILYIARIGHFQLNTVYPIQVLSQLRGDNTFFAFQFTNNGIAQFSMVMLDISATHLAIFITKQQPIFNNDKFQIPEQKSITQCTLIFYAELGTISEIYIDRSNYSDIQLIFTSQKPHNLSLQSCTKIIKLKVKKGLNFLRKLIKNRKYYEISSIKINYCLDNLAEEQRQILQQISKAQKVIQHHLNINTVKKLIDQYQAAIQYYSGHSLPYYQVYLDHITKLYQRQDIKTIMGTNLPQLIKRSSSN